MRRLLKTLSLPVAALVMAVAAAGPSQAAGSVVNVALWDKGADAPMVTNLGLGMGGDIRRRRWASAPRRRPSSPAW